MPDSGSPNNIYRLPQPQPTPEPQAAEPHNEEAEHALLGAILIRNDLLEQVYDTLRPEHFYFGMHGRLYAEMARRIINGSGATPSTLKQWFLADPDGQEFGAKYLVMLRLDGMDIRPQADAIKETWLRREAIATAKELISKATDPQADIKAEFIAVADQIDAAIITPQEAGVCSFDDAVSDAMAEFRAAKQRGGKPTLPIVKFPRLNEAALLEPNRVTTIGGESGEGKSAFVFQLAVDLADWVREQTEQGQHVERGGVMLVSLEMSKAQVATRLLSYFSGLNGRNIRRGLVNDHEFEDLALAEQRLLGLPIQIVDAAALTVAQIKARCRQAQRRFMRHFETKIGLVVVDHLQEVREDETAARGGGTWATERKVRNLLEMARNNDFGHLMALSQMTRPTDKKGDPDWEGGVDNLAWSGATKQISSQIWILRRPEAHLGKTEPEQYTGEMLPHWQGRVEAWRASREKWANRALLTIGKNRDDVAGEVIPLLFHDTTTSFSEEPGYSYGR